MARELGPCRGRTKLIPIGALRRAIFRFKLVRSTAIKGAIMNRTFASLATLAMLTLVSAATAPAQEPMEKKSYNYSA